MKYLLKNNNNAINDFNLLDCPITLLNHFEKGENKGNIYVIDLLNYDETEIFIIKSIIKQIYEIDPNEIIYVIGALSPLNCANGFFNYPNVNFVHSVVDVQSSQGTQR